MASLVGFERVYWHYGFSWSLLLVSSTQPIFHFCSCALAVLECYRDAFLRSEEVPVLPSGTGTIAGRFE